MTATATVAREVSLRITREACGRVLTFAGKVTTDAGGTRIEGTAFVSGYLLSKLDPVLANAIADKGQRSILGFRVAVFMICFLIGALFVYIGRNI